MASHINYQAGINRIVAMAKADRKQINLAKRDLFLIRHRAAQLPVPEVQNIKRQYHRLEAYLDHRQGYEIPAMAHLFNARAHDPKHVASVKSLNDF